VPRTDAQPGGARPGDRSIAASTVTVALASFEGVTSLTGCQPPLAATSGVVTEGPDCQLNYCSGDWDTWVQSDDGFYNCTKGRCPNRHEHTFDD
jgi:hypothetical protein